MILSIAYQLTTVELMAFCIFCTFIGVIGTTAGLLISRDQKMASKFKNFWLKMRGE